MDTSRDPDPQTAFVAKRDPDPRHDDSVLFIDALEKFIDALEKAGVEVEFHAIPDTIHGFMFMPGGVDPAIEAAKDGAGDLKRVFDRLVRPDFSNCINRFGPLQSSSQHWRQPVMKHREYL